MQTSQPYECAVIGGGVAGLSAALTLARARRRTILIDAGGQSNLVAAAIGGVPGRDGTPPDEYYAGIRAEIDAYGSVDFVDAPVAGVTAEDPGFLVEVEGQPAVRALCIVLATGAKYNLPEIEGAAERWGRSVFHCPFCHGWEVRDRRLAVLGPDPEFRRTRLLRAWSDRVSVFTEGGEPNRDELAALTDLGVDVHTARVVALEGEAPALAAVRLEDGSSVECNGLLVPFSYAQKDEGGVLAASLGLELTDHGPQAPEAIAVNPVGGTALPGVFAAGDAAAPMPSIPLAISSGVMAGAAVVHSLLVEPVLT